MIDIGHESTALAIQFDSDAPTVGELKQIISQWCLLQQSIDLDKKHSNTNQDCAIYFTDKTPFFSMNDRDIINWKSSSFHDSHLPKVCLLQLDVQFEAGFSIKHSAMHMENFNHNSHTRCCHYIDIDHPSIQQCPILSPILKINDNYNNNIDNSNSNGDTNSNNIHMMTYTVDHSQIKRLGVDGIKSIKDHLFYYQHFYPLFNLSRAICNQGESCSILQKLLSNVNFNGLTHLEQIHIKLFKHISQKHEKKRLKSTYFEFIKNQDLIKHEKPTKTLLDDISDSFDKNIEYQRVFELMQEMINNGYEKDLFPKDLDDSSNPPSMVMPNLQSNNMDYNKNDQECKQTRSNTYRLMIENYNKYESDFKLLYDMLHNGYRILDYLDAIVDHPRHVLFNKPLYLYELLALYLYCNGDCNYDLSKTLRNNNFTKWKLFDRWLAVAIDKLTRWQRYSDNTNVYSGMAGVVIDKNDIRDDKPFYLRLKCYQSFSACLEKAKMFAGSDGMIIGLNLSQWKNCGQATPISQLTSIRACDVSWLSNYKNEKEILLSRSNELIIWKRNIVQVANYQCVLCCDNVLNCHDLSVETMFVNS